LYRLERGYPFSRAGRLVVAVNQFAGQAIYSPTVSNAPQQGVLPHPQEAIGQTPANQASSTPTRIQFPASRNDLP
jgi:hypothetical protein